MVVTVKECNQLVSCRLTRDFTAVFDHLSDQLGCNRSELIRYVLKRFTATHLNNVENLRKVREDLY